MVDKLKRENAFRLRRSLFYWDRSYDAPFVREIYKKLFDYVQSAFPDIDWAEELVLTRRDIARIADWGELPLKNSQQRMEVKPFGHYFDVRVNKAMWCLLYPDYMLITYPTWPPGKGKKMLPELSNCANPLFYYPSRFWHLPEQVYQYFESIYGPRGYEGVSMKVYDKYVSERERYCQYFSKKYKLPVNHFSRITGARVTQEKPNLKEIFSVD